MISIEKVIARVINGLSPDKFLHFQILYRILKAFIKCGYSVVSVRHGGKAFQGNRSFSVPIASAIQALIKESLHDLFKKDGIA